MAASGARQAYRALLREQRKLFAGDLSGRFAARAETRMQFMQNADASGEEVKKLLQDAEDTVLFIRQNIAQTVLNERGNYELSPSPEHIHEGDSPPPLPFDNDLNGAPATCSSREKAKAVKWTP